MKLVIWPVLAFATFMAGAGAHQALPIQTEPASVSQSSVVSQLPVDSGLACPATVEHQPDTDGIYEVGHGVTVPQITKSVQATFTEEARQQVRAVPNFHAVTLLMLVVDTKGKPKDICVRRTAGFGLDRQAVQAASKYRFRPAMKDGVPVAVRMAVEVNFMGERGSQP